VGALKEAQDDHVAELFRALMRMINARRIVIVCGPNYWWAPSRGILGSLDAQPRPLIASGQLDGRSWVVAYHPGYAFHQHHTAASYVQLLVEALTAVEAAR
jgi:hypothetical protein